MKVSTADLTATDQFCGAGGQTAGAKQVAGVHVAVALNHWRLAIETHNTNHPETVHECADISQVDPRRYPRTDILLTSPECGNHTMARERLPHRPGPAGGVLGVGGGPMSTASGWPSRLRSPPRSPRTCPRAGVCSLSALTARPTSPSRPSAMKPRRSAGLSLRPSDFSGASADAGFNALHRARAEGERDGAERARLEHERHSSTGAAQREPAEIQAAVAAFAEQSGIDLATGWCGGVKDAAMLGRVVAAATKGYTNPDSAARRLRRLAEDLERSIGEINGVADAYLAEMGGTAVAER